MKKPVFGILDFGYINPPELFAYETINSLFAEVGEYAEQGYSRLWLSEHYSPEFAWFNPAMLLPLLAGYSERIRIGWSGVLLNYHSPLLIAQQFKQLSAIYPDRIDLGIARAGVPDHINGYLIANEERGRLKDGWEDKLINLFSFLRNDDPAAGLFSMVVPPHGTSLPQGWILGNSPSSMETALRHRCNFCISFMHPGSDFTNNKDLLRVFKDKYQQLYGELPIAAALVPCVATADSAKAEQFNTQYSDCREANAIGTVGYVQDRLSELQETLSCDELILFSPEWRRELRIDSFRQIANF